MDESNKKKIVKKGGFLPYVIGFLLSVILTTKAYLLVEQHVNSYHKVLPHEILIPAILGLAFAQLVVQLFFFLHLGQEKKPRWNLVAFLSTVSVILIVVIGSLWIMAHLNYHMSPYDMNMQIQAEEGVHK